jgi:hypothetical protein
VCHKERESDTPAHMYKSNSRIRMGGGVRAAIEIQISQRSAVPPGDLEASGDSRAKELWKMTRFGTSDENCPER